LLRGIPRQGSEFAPVPDYPPRTSRATSWPIWNEAWDTPLISVSRESFERFVVGRLEEPGVVDELVGLAAA